MDYSSEKQVSEFNEAIFQLKRLNDIWFLCAKLREQGNFNMCKAKLDSAQIELNYDIKRLDNKDTDYVNKLKDMNDDLNKAAKEKNRETVYNKLMEKEMLLRDIQEEAGKGGKWKDSEGSELDL